MSAGTCVWSELVLTAFFVYAATMVVVTIIIAGMANNHKREVRSLRNTIENDAKTINSLNALLIERNGKIAQWQENAREAVELLELEA